VLHGGGWSRGSKDMLAPHATALAEQGFVAIASEYRLTGEARFPAQIHDTKRAIRWVRSQAGELGFDPDKLCLEGHSAGAHLALLAAATPDDARLDPPEGAGGVSAAVAAVAAVAVAVAASTTIAAAIQTLFICVTFPRCAGQSCRTHP